MAMKMEDTAKKLGIVVHKCRLNILGKCLNLWAPNSIRASKNLTSCRAKINQLGRRHLSWFMAMTAGGRSLIMA